jgi:hypothetical protein
MSEQMVLVPRVATEEMKLAGYSTLVHVFDDEGCEPNPGDWGRAYTSMIKAFDPITWKVARNQVIRELIENVPEGLWGFSPSEQEAVSEWAQVSDGCK